MTNEQREYAEYVEYFTATTGLEPMSIEDWRKANEAQAAQDKANRNRG